MSQTRLLTSAALAVGLALGIAAPGLAEQRLLRHDEAAPGRLDPAKVSDYSASVLAYNIYDTLVEPKPAGGVVPSLAESWSVSEDGTKYTFKLVEGVKFHSGNTLSAEDVVFSLERMVALASGHSRLLAGITATADDALTVTFTLPAPNAAFLSSMVRMPIVDKATVLANIQPGNHGEFGDYGEDFLSREGAGTGAYKVTAHNPQAETSLVLFDDYFGDVAEKAPTDVLIRYGVQAPTVRTLMSNNEWEVTSQWLPAEVKRALVEGGKELVGEAGSGFFVMPLNTQRAPTDDVHVRRAISLALDYDIMRKLVEVVPGTPGSKELHGVIPSGLFGHDASLPVPKQDLEAAKAELAKSKYAGNIPTLEVIWVAEVPVEEKFAMLMQQNLGQIGMKVDVVKMPWALLVDRAAKPETTPNVTQVFTLAAYPDPDALLGRNHSTNMGTTIKMDWADDKVLDDFLEKGKTATDEAERLAIYKAAQEHMLNEVTNIWAFESLTTYVKQPGISAPALDDPSQSVAVQGGNWQFRKWSMGE